jgi:hypothetical protein
MRYIKLNELISKFFLKLPFFVIIYIISFIILKLASPSFTYDYEIKNTVSPGVIADQIFEKEGKLVARIDNTLFRNKYNKAGGVSKYAVSLNKVSMVEVTFKGDSKEQIFVDTEIFIDLLQSDFRSIKNQSKVRDRYVKFYETEIEKLNKISSKEKNAETKVDSSFEYAFKNLVNVSKDSNLSRQRVDVSEKLIRSQSDENIVWLYSMNLSDVAPANYNTLIAIASFAFTMFIYFSLLLIRYGKKFDD